MKLRILIILFFISCIAHAQFKISGVVLDAQQQPLPYVNVYFKNSTNGIVTDFEGKFELTSTKKRGRIEISSVGYKTETIRFGPKKRHFTIYLEEESNTLEEVVIVVKPKKRLRKKENPAYRILKEIWKRKKKNGLKLVSYYQYKKLQTTAISLNNLDTVFLQEIFKKSYKKTIDELPYNENGINGLPSPKFAIRIGIKSDF